MNEKFAEEMNAETKKLICAVRNGDESSFAELLSKYEPLIMSLTAKYASERSTAEDREDMHQEMRMAFYSAVMHYDLGREEISFGLYAKVCIRNALLSRRRKSGDGGIEIFPIEEFSELSDSDDPTRGVIESESETEVKRLIDENLSAYEKTVWSLHLDGKSPRAIAAELEREVKSIDNALSRIRMKLRRVFGGQEK